MKLLKIAILPAALLLLATGCATTPQPDCSLPDGKNLRVAIEVSKAQLTNGCEALYDAYFDRLLTVAEGDPKPRHKQTFSEFLEWSTDSGLLSQRQAQAYYNRYFNVKFMSLAGDYNNCSYTCPRQAEVLTRMEEELSDKEQGLLRVALDRDSYYRADQLLKETELVLAATCTACAAN
ncbi:MAG: hypothetical protein KJO54_00180 [Gammaproteobacteria bacterium]|nr:hypothetical protein [Gammaproteobacteria bacterium]NNF62105.1 hypothetical protein [Gammaproteobacteria bacterium]NNM20489.1 hypothetical protein [Gammaproteobacteria bacterium]